MEIVIEEHDGKTYWHAQRGKSAYVKGYAEDVPKAVMIPGAVSGLLIPPAIIAASGAGPGHITWLWPFVIAMIVLIVAGAAMAIAVMVKAEKLWRRDHPKRSKL